MFLIVKRNLIIAIAWKKNNGCTMRHKNRTQLNVYVPTCGHHKMHVFQMKFAR